MTGGAFFVAIAMEVTDIRPMTGDARDTERVTMATAGELSVDYLKSNTKKSNDAK